MHEVAQTCKNVFETVAYHMVSDNAANMTSTGRNIAHAMSSSTCMAHTANLLTKDLLDFQTKKEAYFKNN